MTVNYTPVLAFKVQAEPGWRGVCVVHGDLVDGQPELRQYKVTVTNIGYWGMSLHSRTVSPNPLAGSFLGLFGGGPEFEPLDINGNAFEDLRRIVSPAETLSNDELLAEVTATLNKKP
jgi:hypothetical protein